MKAALFASVLVAFAAAAIFWREGVPFRQGIFWQFGHEAAAGTVWVQDGPLQGETVLFVFGGLDASGFTVTKFTHANNEVELRVFK